MQRKQCVATKQKNKINYNRIELELTMKGNANHIYLSTKIETKSSDVVKNKRHLSDMALLSWLCLFLFVYEWPNEKPVYDEVVINVARNRLCNIDCADITKIIFSRPTTTKFKTTKKKKRTHHHHHHDLVSKNYIRSRTVAMHIDEITFDPKIMSKKRKNKVTI